MHNNANNYSITLKYCTCFCKKIGIIIKIWGDKFFLDFQPILYIMYKYHNLEYGFKINWTEILFLPSFFMIEIKKMNKPNLPKNNTYFFLLLLVLLTTLNLGVIFCFHENSRSTALTDTLNFLLNFSTTSLLWLAYKHSISKGTRQANGSL
jgi:hypothetical protein